MFDDDGEVGEVSKGSSNSLAASAVVEMEVDAPVTSVVGMVVDAADKSAVVGVDAAAVNLT